MSFFLVLILVVLLLLLLLLGLQRVYILKCPLVHKLATLPPNPQKIKIRDKTQKDPKKINSFL
jgi:hypothetical protein